MGQAKVPLVLDNDLDGSQKLLCFEERGEKFYYTIEGHQLMAYGVGEARLRTRCVLNHKPEGKDCLALRGHSSTHIAVKYLDDNDSQALVELRDLTVLEMQHSIAPLKANQSKDYYKVDGQYIQRGTALKDKFNRRCQVWNPATTAEFIVRYSDGKKRRVPARDVVLEKAAVEVKSSSLPLEYDAQLRKVDDVFPNYVLRPAKDTSLQEYAEKHGCCAGLSIYDPAEPHKIVDANHLLCGEHGGELDIARLFQIARENDMSDVLLLSCAEPTDSAASLESQAKNCSACGQVSAPEAMFCSACGTALEIDAPNSSKVSEFCKNFTESVLIPKKRVRDLTESAREADFWTPLKEMSNLRCLRINEANGIGAAACKHFQQLKGLTTLFIGDGNDIRADGCRELSEVRSLTSLHIGTNNIGHVGCEYLKGLQGLTHLGIGKMNEVGPSGCNHLKEMQHLTSLTIGGSNSLGEEGCKHLAFLAQLTSLDLGKRNNITVEGCAHLKVFSQLKSLQVGGFNKICAEGCEHLKDLKSLTRLRIGGYNHIGIDGCEHLKQLEPSACICIRANGNDIGDEHYGPYCEDEEDQDGDDEESKADTFSNKDSLYSDDPES